MISVTAPHRKVGPALLQDLLEKYELSAKRKDVNAISEISSKFYELLMFNIFKEFGKFLLASNNVVL